MYYGGLNRFRNIEIRLSGKTSEYNKIPQTHLETQFSPVLRPINAMKPTLGSDQLPLKLPVRTAMGDPEPAYLWGTFMSADIAAAII